MANVILTKKGNNLIYNAVRNNTRIQIDELAVGITAQPLNNNSVTLKAPVVKLKVSGNYANDSTIRIYAIDKGSQTYGAVEFLLIDNLKNVIAIYSEPVVGTKAIYEKLGSTPILFEFILNLKGKFAKYFLFKQLNSIATLNNSATKLGIFRLATAEETRGAVRDDVAIHVDNFKMLKLGEHGYLKQKARIQYFLNTVNKFGNSILKFKKFDESKKLEPSDKKINNIELMRLGWQKMQLKELKNFTDIKSGLIGFIFNLKENKQKSLAWLALFYDAGRDAFYYKTRDHLTHDWVDLDLPFFVLDTKFNAVLIDAFITILKSTNLKTMPNYTTATGEGVYYSENGLNIVTANNQAVFISCKHQAEVLINSDFITNKNAFYSLVGVEILK